MPSPGIYLHLADRASLHASPNYACHYHGASRSARGRRTATSDKSFLIASYTVGSATVRRGSCIWHSSHVCRQANRRTGLDICARSLTLEPTGSYPPIEITQASVVLGSGNDADFKVVGAADAHAKIEVKANSVYLTDLGSGQGTWIDDNKLWPEVAYLLAPNSSIVLGGADKGDKAAEYKAAFEAVETKGGSTMDDFLAESFKQSFQAGATEEVRKLLDEDK